MSTAFDGACRDIARIEADTGPPSPDDRAALVRSSRVVVTELPSLIRQWAPELRRCDLEEVSQEALLKFLTMARRGQIRLSQSPAGYLLVIGQRLVQDRRRSPGYAVAYTDLASLPPTAAEEDDATSRVVEQLDSAGDFEAGMAVARERGDEAVLATVTLWRDLAHRLNDRPGSRAVADAQGVSKTIVNRRLKTFAGYVEEARRRRHTA